MLLKTVLTVVALVAAPFAQAAFITTNEAGLDAIFSQASFGSRTVDIRIGAVTQLVRPDLLNITTDAEINAIFSQHVGAANVVNFYFVDTIDSCGGFNTNYIGCGEFPGNDFVVESIWAADNTLQTGGYTFGQQLLAHELGHNLGLDHRNGNNLMNPFINGYGDLNAAEVDTILASNLIQTDAAGRFIMINPVLVVTAAVNDVPEPSSLLLVLGALGAALGVFGRQSRQRATT